jgi:endonuclease/exonuclease/phosphatase family metal-dependent hydrolase
MGQEGTLRIMHYNLLNYGNFPDSYCTLEQNHPSMKDSCMRVILSEVLPDIVCVNEIGSNPFYHQRLLDSAFNYSGEALFAKGPFTNYANSYIVNQIFYRTSKFGLANHQVINTYIRDINLYRMYAIPTLPNQDTLFFYCISAHLKAGSEASDKTDRATMTSEVMTWLQAHPEASNCILMGDFNIQTASETSYQNLLNWPQANIRFYDPIQTSGSWNNNGQYAGIHTQSTHSSSNGCAASGGLDDRFDFLLISDEIRDGTQGIQYIPGSYHATGQDGNHFNASINTGSNSVASPQLTGALFLMSDHLPVVADFNLTFPSLAIHSPKPSDFPFRIEISGKELKIFPNDFSSSIQMASIFDLSGHCLLNAKGKTLFERPIRINISYLSSGIYHLTLTTGSSTFTTKFSIL